MVVITYAISCVGSFLQRNVHLNTSTCSLRLLDEIGQIMSYMGILVSSRITHETNTCEVVRETKRKVAFRVKLQATDMSAIFSQITIIHRVKTDNHKENK